MDLRTQVRWVGQNISAPLSLSFVYKQTSFHLCHIRKQQRLLILVLNIFFLKVTEMNQNFDLFYFSSILVKCVQYEPNKHTMKFQLN